MIDPFDQKKVFKVLSIDGGGIKGLYSAKILEQLELEYGGSLSDYFDLLCGTSTGGIIALALSLKIPAKDIVEFYRIDGPKIFSHRSKLRRSIEFAKQLLLRSKYSSSQLERALNNVFQEAQIKDSNNLLCIPSFNISTGENRVFKRDYGSLRWDNELRMVDVALATSAAPTYFPLHQLRNSYYVDGGIWANNPALCGLLETLKSFVGIDKDFNSFSILSVASLNHTNGFHIEKKWHSFLNHKRFSFRDWGGKLFQVTLDGQSEFVDFFLKSVVARLSPEGKFVRIPTCEISPENVAHISLDKANNKSIELLQIYGERQGIKYRTQPEIAAFFKSKKLYNIN